MSISTLEPPAGLGHSDEIPFLGEERGGRLRAPLLWVLDPVEWGATYDRDGSEHGVESRFTLASAPGLKASLLDLLRAS